MAICTLSQRVILHLRLQFSQRIRFSPSKHPMKNEPDLTILIKYISNPQKYLVRGTVFDNECRIAQLVYTISISLVDR